MVVRPIHYDSFPKILLKKLHYISLLTVSQNILLY